MLMVITTGVEMRVNTTTADSQQQPSVAALSGGGYVVTWQFNNHDGSGAGVYMQRYDASGVAQGVETLVNTTTADGHLSRVHFEDCPGAGPAALRAANSQRSPPARSRRSGQVLAVLGVRLPFAGAGICVVPGRQRETITNKFAG